MSQTQMKESQRAAQLWSILVLAARNQQILSYNTVRHLTGIATVGIGGCLGPVIHYCRDHKLPWLTVLVVNEETGLPGDAFLNAARNEFGDKMSVFELQSRVFAYDWFKLDTPTPSDFEPYCG